MPHKYQFNTTDWQNDFNYAVAPHIRAKAKFTVENGDLKNEYNDQIGEHDYISVISKKRYGVGTEIKAKCSFSGTGAPCFVFTNDLSTDGEYLKYGLHFEVCAYVGGVNVWRIEPWPERVECPIKTAKLHAAAWEPSTTELECTVKFGDKKITVCVEDKEFCVECEDFPTEMHLGFTACEGPCTIHSYEITEAAE